MPTYTAFRCDIPVRDGVLDTPEFEAALSRLVDEFDGEPWLDDGIVVVDFSDTTSIHAPERMDTALREFAQKWASEGFSVEGESHGDDWEFYLGPDERSCLEEACPDPPAGRDRAAHRQDRS